MQFTPKLDDAEFRDLAVRYAEEAMARLAPVPEGLTLAEEMSARITRTALLTQMVLALQSVDFVIENCRSAMSAFDVMSNAPQPSEEAPS